MVWSLGGSAGIEAACQRDYLFRDVFFGTVILRAHSSIPVKRLIIGGYKGMDG